MLWKLLVVTLLALGLTTAVACGGDDDDDDGGESAAAETTAPASETGEPTATGEASASPDSGEPMTIQLEASDYMFNLGTISAPAGTEVTIEFSNVGDAPHTFTSDDLGINEQLTSGESTTITFTMPDTPTEFHCAIHPSLMMGTLQPVTGDSAAQPQSDGTSTISTRY